LIDIVIKKVISLTIGFLLLLILGTPDLLADSSEKEYKEAYKSFKSLEVSKVKRKYRSNWTRCAKKFKDVYKRYPKGSKADDAMYMVGKIYLYLYGYSNKGSDLDEAIRSYRMLIKRYPKSKLTYDAQFRVAVIYDKYKNDKSKAYVEYSKVISNFSKGKLTRKAKLRLNKLNRYKPTVQPKRPSAVKHGAPGLVTEIRHWSNPNYTRVVIHVKEKISYAMRLLRKDPSIKKPPRLYVDLKNTTISPALHQTIPIHDGLLKRVRAGQHTKDSVRIVLDIEDIKSYKVFPLADPYRIVVDVIGESTLSKKAPSKSEDVDPLSLTQQLGLRVGKIVIDPGHGGHDPGAIGPSGLKEKDVVLKISKGLEKILKERLDCEVVLTRRDDRFIPLEERTAIANTQKADLFISIHANASPNRNTHGIQTYFLNLSSDEEAIRVAARENATSTKKISDLQPILRELMMNSKINESSRLARFIQEALLKELRSNYSEIRDLGVKQAPFYVLIGAEMPSVLVEVSFVSNKMEEKRLRNNKYLNNLASSIMTGIGKYINGMRVAAY